MKAYEIMKNSYPKAPEEFYLYISRRATIPITLNNRLDFFKLSELIDIYKYTPITILKYIKNILHNTEKINEEAGNRTSKEQPYQHITNQFEIDTTPKDYIDYELVGFSEIDKYAINSYCAIHRVDKMINLNDVSKINVESLPLLLSYLDK